LTLDPAKAHAFREELAELYGRYGLMVDSCGCCSNWITPSPTGAGTPEQQARLMDVFDASFDPLGDRKPVLPGIPLSDADPEC
jgi:hypothetical protein